MTEPWTDAVAKEAQAVCDAATEGPWEWQNYGFDEYYLSSLAGKKKVLLRLSPGTPDSKFIPGARSGWPRALKRIREQDEEIARLRARTQAAEDEVVRYSGYAYDLAMRIQYLQGVLGEDPAGWLLAVFEDRLRNALKAEQHSEINDDKLTAIVAQALMCDGNKLAELMQENARYRERIRELEAGLEGLRRLHSIHNESGECLALMSERGEVCYCGIDDFNEPIDELLRVGEGGKV